MGIVPFAFPKTGELQQKKTYPCAAITSEFCSALELRATTFSFIFILKPFPLFTHKHRNTQYGLSKFRAGPRGVPAAYDGGAPAPRPVSVTQPQCTRSGPTRGSACARWAPGRLPHPSAVTRDGHVSSPAWSFGARFPTRGTLRTPGPGAHAPERCPPMREPRAPLYSMGARLGFALNKPGPAPNAYALRMGPGTPAYTMGARIGFDLKAKSPGPAVYFQRDADVYKDKSPRYSLGARVGGAGRGTRTPGPAAYPPHLYNTNKNPYAYSFGRKHGDCAPPMIVREDTMDCL
ncbi:hypothetical protein evm_013083 [Chilo suppressalis]|nr:hypothetical protein evm_013083 [Chilo suppressalis]